MIGSETLSYDDDGIEVPQNVGHSGVKLVEFQTMSLSLWRHFAFGQVLASTSKAQHNPPSGPSCWSTMGKLSS